MRLLSARRLAGIIAVAGLAIGVGPTSADAVDGTGALRGTVVSDADGEPIEGICVSVRENGVSPPSLSFTGPDGAYEFAGVAPGAYAVYFETCGGQDFLSEYHENAYQLEDATLVAISAGESLVVDAALGSPGEISGLLTDAATGEHLPGTCVRLHDAVGGGGRSTEATTSDDSGAYSFDRLPPGGYRVLFSPYGCADTHLPQWYPDAASVEDAAIIDLGLGAVASGINGALTRGGSISGQVEDQDGVPLSILVEVHGEALEEPLTANSIDGQFTVRPLPIGDFNVQFADDNFVYVHEWYDDESKRENSTAVSISATGQEVSGIDAVLVEGGRVRGTVSGIPYEVLCVSVHSLDGELVRYGFAEGAGRFNIGALATGRYRVSAGGCADVPGRFLTVWHGGSLSPNESTVVDVTAGYTTWQVDIVATIFPEYDPAATVALVERSGRWHVIRGDATGDTLYFGLPTDLPVLGDWDCDGRQTAGQFRSTSGYFYLTNGSVTDTADEAFFFGQPGDMPVVGDWDGDGCDSVGVYRPSESKVFLRNSLTTGFADVEYEFGFENGYAFGGDFDGNGQDEVGLHDRSSGLVRLRYSHTTGAPDREFYYGAPGDVMFSGDWNGDGIDTIGVYRDSTARLFLSFVNETRPADVGYRFGSGGQVPAT